MKIDTAVHFNLFVQDAAKTYINPLVIKGRITEMGSNIPCRVRLFEKSTGRLISDIQTDVNGNYEFRNLSKAKFFIVAHHPASQYNAVIQDNVVPK